MILAIDIGNTTVEFGFVEDGKILDSFKLYSNVDKTADDWFINIKSILSSGLEKKIKDFVISSVVPQIESKITNAIKLRFKKKPLIIGKDLDIPVKNKYKNPQEVGIDRLVNAYGAIKKYSSPLIIVDLGTAITFDVVNKEGEYEGGAIFSGIDSSLKALFSKTAKLPMVSITNIKNVVGKTTVESIQSGIFNGYCSLIEGMVMRITNEFGYSFNTVLTGGNANLISEGLSIKHYLDKYLSLESIYLIYKLKHSKL